MHKFVFFFIFLLLPACATHKDQRRECIRKPNYVTKEIKRELTNYALRCSDLSCLGEKSNHLPQWFKGFSSIGNISLADDSYDMCSEIVYKVRISVHEHAYLSLLVRNLSTGYKVVGFRYGEVN